MRFLRAAPRTLAALAALIVASCTEQPPLQPLVDESALPPPVTPPADAAPPYDVAACKTCLANQCIAEHVRCYEQPGCVTIVNCANTLNCNQECINKCFFNQVGFGRREYQALTTCEFEASCGTCDDVCGRSSVCVLRSGDFSDSGTPDAGGAPVTCGGCMRERCNDVLQKCAPGTPCDAYFSCTNPCLEPRDACVADCGVKNAQGKADAEAALACANNTCKVQCVY